MASSDSGANEEPTDKSFSPPSSTLLRRKPLATNANKEMLPQLPNGQETTPIRGKPTPKTRPSFSTSFLIIISIILGVIVVINVIIASRVLFSIFKKSSTANRNKAHRRGSIEINGPGGVRLEEITTIDGDKIQVYKGKRFSLLPDITSTNGSFLIVEPRAHSLLPMVCAEFDKKVPPDWALYIIHSYSNADFARRSVESITRKKVFMQLNTKSLEVDDYNTIFKNPDFWQFIKTEYILVFQTDSVPCGPMLDMNRYGQFGYIGCAYYDKVGPNTGYWDEGWSFYGSGGLSLRRKSFTLKCLEWYILNNKEPHEYEDVTFSHCVDVLYGDLHYSKPTLDDVGEFCVQNSWGDVSREPRSFGAHQHQGQMHDRGLKRRFLTYCPIAALI